MNYYEELGIRPDADEEEIRKAHRRLVKLMHPDHQRDQGLKQLAETQMRRLNSIVATLLDPEEREEYDEQLRSGSLNGDASGGPVASQSAWRAIPWWIASTLGAIILTVLAVWFWADRMNSGIKPAHQTVESLQPAEPSERQQPSSSVTVVDVPQKETPQPPKVTVVPVPPQPAPPVVRPEPPKTAVVTPPPPAPAPKPQPVIPKPQEVKVVPPPPLKKLAETVAQQYQKPPTRPVVKPAEPPRVAVKVEQPKATLDQLKAEAKKKLPDLPVVSSIKPPKTPWDKDLRAPGSVTADPVETASIGPIPTTRERVPEPPPVAPIRPRINDPLEGEWVYAPSEPEKRRPGLYPPEFINLKLTKDTDGMRGHYSARYSVDKVADSRPISPEVRFELKSVDKTARKYVWTAADGSRGTFVIRSLEPDVMRLEWHTTNTKSGPALTSGMATLVRRVN